MAPPGWLVQYDDYKHAAEADSYVREERDEAVLPEADPQTRAPRRSVTNFADCLHEGSEEGNSLDIEPQSMVPGVGGEA